MKKLFWLIALTLSLTSTSLAQTFVDNISFVTGTTQVTVSWTTPVPTSTQVQYDLSSVTTWRRSVKDANLVTVHTAVLKTAIVAGGVYKLRIVATDSLTEKVTSAVYGFTASSVPPPPTHAVDLTWNPNPTVSYIVYRSGVSGSGYTPIATGQLVDRYTDDLVESGATYYYVVTAVNEVGESGYSNEAKAVIPTP